MRTSQTQGRRQPAPDDLYMPAMPPFTLIAVLRRWLRRCRRLLGAPRDPATAAPPCAVPPDPRR